MGKDSNVFILYTGGTIGMAPAEKGNPASPFEKWYNSRIWLFR